MTCSGKRSMSGGKTVPITLSAAAKAASASTGGSTGGGDKTSKVTSTTVVPGGPDVFYSNSSFPWDEELVEVETCDNSCSMARNGRCDDGRAGTGDQVWPAQASVYTHYINFVLRNNPLPFSVDPSCMLISGPQVVGSSLTCGEFLAPLWCVHSCKGVPCVVEGL
jgi:hypothetical protein